MADEIAAAGAEPEDDILVELDGAEGAGEGAEAGAAGSADAKIVSPEEGVAALKAQLEEERRAKAEESAARHAAEERAQQLDRSAQTARGSEIDGRIGQIKAALETVTTRSEASDRAYEDAMTRGDYKAAAKAQREMAEQAVAKSRLEDGMRQLEAQKAAPPRPAQPRPGQAADPFEAFVSNLAPRARDWMRQHPEFVKDPKKNRELQAAHLMALNEHDEGSDGYYAAVESRLGLGKAEAAAAPARRAAAPVAAPVSRGQPSIARAAAPSGPQTVKLTKDEVSMASAMGIPLKDYARQKAQVAAEVAAGKHPTS